MMTNSTVKKLSRHLRAKLSYRTGGNFSKPELIYLKLTEKCNFHCQHCDIWKTDISKDLTLEQWDLIIDDLKKFRSDLVVTISGGEPLLYDNFWPLVKLLKNKGVGVQINTNGSLITEVVAKRLLEMQIDKIEISLYSLNPEVHDNLRNTPLAHQRAARAVKFLLARRDKNTEILLAFLLNRYNLDELVSFIEYYSKLGVWTTIQSIDTNIQLLDQGNSFQSQKQELKESDLWINDSDKIKKLFKKLIQMKKDGFLIYNRLDQFENMEKYYLSQFDNLLKLPCYSGQNNLIINNHGNAFFCFKGPSIGNLLVDPVNKIWSSKRAKQVRQEIKNCQLACRIMNCNYNNSLFNKGLEYIKKRIP